MLMGLWRIIVEFFMHIAQRVQSRYAGSQPDCEPFNNWQRDIGSHLIAGSQKGETSDSASASLLPNTLTIVDHASVSREAWRGDRPELQSLIEVSHVEGEFLPKSLRTRSRGEKSPRPIFWFAAAVVMALVFAGVKIIPRTDVVDTTSAKSTDAGDRVFENSNAITASREDKAFREIKKAGEVAAAAGSGSISQQGESPSVTDTASHTPDQTISPVVDEVANPKGDAATFAASQPVGKNNASADGDANAPPQIVGVERTDQKSHKGSLPKQEGVSFVPKNIASVRSQKVNAHPVRTVRSSSGGVPDTVVNGLLGGLAGAVVGGPVGLVAGAAVGATAGKAIAHSWGLR